MDHSQLLLEARKDWLMERNFEQTICNFRVLLLAFGQYRQLITASFDTCSLMITRCGAAAGTPGKDCGNPLHPEPSAQQPQTSHEQA